MRERNGRQCTGTQYLVYYRPMPDSRYAPTPADRCPARLEAAIPDIDQHIGAAYVLQCEKPPGHPGAHRIKDYTLTWRTE